MLRKTQLKIVTTLALAAGIASTASAHKSLYWFPGSNLASAVTHSIYQGDLINDTHSQSRDFVQLIPNVPDSIADDYEFKLNNACDGVWDGWSPNYISAELGDVVHDYCPSSSQTTTGAATYMGEK